METALKAIAAPRRRQILTLVRDGELSAGEIASHFDGDATGGLAGPDAAEGGRARGRTAQRHKASLPRASRGNGRAAGLPGGVLGLRASMRSNGKPNERRGRRVEMTTTTTEAPVYERVLQIDASPETVWEFLVDPEKVARWKGLPATAFDAAARRGVPDRDHPRARRERRVRRARAAAPARLHLGLGAGRRTARTRCRRARRRSRSSWSPWTAARGCGSPIATCPASRPRSRTPRAGITTSAARHGGAGRRPRARPVARRARLIERRSAHA